MNRLRLVHVALVAFTTAVSVAAAATAAVALAGCSSAPDVQNNTSDRGASGPSVVTAPELP